MSSLRQNLLFYLLERQRSSSCESPCRVICDFVAQIYSQRYCFYCDLIHGHVKSWLLISLPWTRDLISFLKMDNYCLFSYGLIYFGNFQILIFYSLRLLDIPVYNIKLNFLMHVNLIKFQTENLIILNITSGSITGTLQ